MRFYDRRNAIMALVLFLFVLVVDFPWLLWQQIRMRVRLRVIQEGEVQGLALSRHGEEGYILNYPRLEYD